jgi:type I restriction enzyme S subunit
MHGNSGCPGRSRSSFDVLRTNGRGGGKVRADWQSKTFEDCIEKVTYTTKIQRKDFLDAGAFPVVSQEDAFINGYWDGADDVFRVETPLVIFGDHTKVLKFIDFDFVLGADGVKLLPPKEFLVPKFFYYQLQTAELDSLGYARHYKLLKELEIKYPDRVEQHRIVAILDQAFDGIATAKANAEKNLQNARALFESHVQSVFTERGEGWGEKRLKDVCEKITDGTHQTPKYFDEGVVFLSSKNVTSGKIDWENIKYIDTAQHLEMHRRVAPRVGDILLAKNGTTGVAAMVDRDVVFDIYVSLALLRSLGEVQPRLLLYFINSPVAKHQFNKRLKGVGVPNLHLQEIREVVIGFPHNLREQDAIVERLDSLIAGVERLESLYQQKLTALDELKKSLLHQAFSGAL